MDKAKQEERMSKEFAAMEEAAERAYQEDLKRMGREAAGLFHINLIILEQYLNGTSKFATARLRLRTICTGSDVSKATTPGETPGWTPGVAVFAGEVSGETAGQAQQETQQ